MNICKACGSEECKQCATCGKQQCEHHEFVPINRPPNCVCEALEWKDPANLPPICKQYVGNGQTNCQICEHDIACHKKD